MKIKGKFSIVFWRNSLHDSVVESDAFGDVDLWRSESDLKHVFARETKQVAAAETGELLGEGVKVAPLEPRLKRG